MRNHTWKIIASLMLGAVSFSRPVLAQTPVAAPVAPAALEIQISSSLEGKQPFPTFPSGLPYFNLIFRNVSAKPIQLVGENNSAGSDNIHLEITAINGKALPEVLMIKRMGRRTSLENRFYTEILTPNQAMVREIRLHVPAIIRHPNTPLTESEKREDNPDFAGMDKNEYWFFPFTTHDNKETITMKAVYEMPRLSGPSNIWTGRIESPLLTYRISSYTFGY